MKVGLDILTDVLKEHKLDKSLIDKIVREVEKTAERIKEEEKEHKVKPAKKKFVVVLTGSDIKDVGDITGFIVQIPEDKSSTLVKKAVLDGVSNFNTTKKGQKWPVKTVGEACESVGGKFFKCNGMTVKTKSPVEFIELKNKISEN